MQRWLEAAGLAAGAPVTLPPAGDRGLTVKIWSADNQSQRQEKAA
jgi:hypothetical protein